MHGDLNTAILVLILSVTIRGVWILSRLNTGQHVHERKIGHLEHETYHHRRWLTLIAPDKEPRRS